ncbi:MULTISPECIES: tape measure protein [Stutzerimonas stutzeri subgroup]|nr:MULTISPECIES: tape measure protein [Stutzerimonas stutzeri subgroup]MCQ2040267.1 tape measure protein [Stutzerimonas kunmingensis]QSH74588.1 tape measure protein [Pseudomonas phage vB_PstS-pAN]
MLMAKVTTQLVIDGKNNSKRAFDEVNSQLETMNRQLASAGKALIGVFSVSALTGAVRGIANAADSYNLMNARLKLATSSQEEFNTAQSELRRIATATQAPLESLATLYQRISRPLQEAGRSQKDILAVTEAVATSFRVSGASAQEAENGVIQFAQALGAGALRGEEFNSVAEQAPRLMQALADSLNVPIGSLKEMASQGLLTADVVTTALVEQLAVLRAEAESLPETVGGAMTALSDRWNEAIGKADVEPLIEAINSLGDTLGDPVVVDNLVKLASALATLAGSAVDGASEFVDLGQRIAFVAANAAGMVTELDKVDQQIADIDRSLSGTGLNTTLAGMWFSEDELKAKREALVAFRAAIVEQQTGMSAELSAAAAAAAAQAEAEREKEISSRNTYIAELKSQQDRLVKSSEAAAKALVAAEKKANSELEKVRSKRLDIEKRYQEAIAGMSAGGEASYGAAQTLKVGAREALRAGDVEGAQAQAQAALKMLEELRAAGANTYGFEGFIGELRDIELAANDIEQSRAEQKIADIKQEMLSLKSAAAELQDMPVSVKMDDAALAQVQSALDALAKREIIVQVGAQYDFSQPYTLQDPGPEPAGYATGGYIRGPGTGTSDSILMYGSNGEYMINAATVRKLGVPFLNMINQGIVPPSIPRFAEGGLIGQVASMEPHMPRLGVIDFKLGGDTYQLYAPANQVDPLRAAARKFGRTHR